LLAIRRYHESRGDTARNICLIPSSAHGTNPASAQMAGMAVVVVACDNDGNVDLADLDEKLAAHEGHVAAIMITYPSTHGVFETEVARILMQWSVLHIRVSLVAMCHISICTRPSAFLMAAVDPALVP